VPRPAVDAPGPEGPPAPAGWRTLMPLSLLGPAAERSKAGDHGRDQSTSLASAPKGTTSSGQVAPELGVLQGAGNSLLAVGTFPCTHLIVRSRKFRSFQPRRITGRPPLGVRISLGRDRILDFVRRTLRQFLHRVCSPLDEVWRRIAL